MAKRQIPETDDLEIVPDAVSSAEADVAKHERRTFAFKMLAGGVVACILPFVGLTIKGLPAEGCFIVGLIFVLIGFVALLTSFSSKVDRVAVNGTKVVMYGIIGFFGLIFVAAAGFLVFIGVGPLLFAKPQPAAPIGPVNPIFAGPQMPAVPGVQGAPAGQKMITISDLSAGLQARAALESTTPATFDQVAAKFLTGGNPDEVQQTLNYLGSKKPSGPHDQISAALIALMNRPGASLSDIMQICRSLGTWGVAGSYADLLKWAKSASSTQRLIVRRALKDLRTANPNATEILNPEAELGQLALAWIKPGAIADIDVLVELSTAKTPPRMPGLAELLRPSICGENTQATARLATQSIQLWGSPASYPPLLELTKNAKGNERLKGRAPLTALRDGLPMAPEILPVDRELLQISLVWLDGKPFPGLNEHLKALADAKPQRTSNELTVLLIPYLDPQFEKKTNVAALGGLLKWGTGTAIAPISKRFENETTPEIKKAATAITEALKKRVEAIKNSKKPKPDSTK